MPLHHFLPHASTVAVALSAALAAAVVYVKRRDRLALGQSSASFTAWLRDLIGVNRTGVANSLALRIGSTGNASFDDYRAQTLKKLEDEAAEFRAYLNNLRAASDRAEFEEFVKARKEGAAVISN